MAKKAGRNLFAELSPAEYFMLNSPVREIQLNGRSRPLAAVVLLIGIALGGVIIYRASCGQMRSIGFSAVAVVRATAYATYALGP